MPPMRLDKNTSNGNVNRNELPERRDITRVTRTFQKLHSLRTIDDDRRRAQTMATEGGSVERTVKQDRFCSLSSAQFVCKSCFTNSGIFTNAGEMCNRKCENRVRLFLRTDGSQSLGKKAAKMLGERRIPFSSSTRRDQWTAAAFRTKRFAVSE
jgi:hypothetical protein